MGLHPTGGQKHDSKWTVILLQKPFQYFSEVNILCKYFILNISDTCLILVAPDIGVFGLVMGGKV